MKLILYETSSDDLPAEEIRPTILIL